MLNRTSNLIFLTAVLWVVAGCTSGNQFGLASDANGFKQRVTSTDVKVDILWVIDDSGSMETSQKNLTANFNSFIDKFDEKNFDFRMAVISTGAWRALPGFDNDSRLSRFQDGTDATSHTGIFVMQPTTANLHDVFVTNATLGITGDADERGLQSIEAALTNSDNLKEDFLRPDALLAVIVLTDEDDFSTTSNQNDQNIPDPYNNPLLIGTDYYYDFLMNLTKSTESNRNFIFNTIGILDEQCRAQISQDWGGRKIVQRYMEVTAKSDGYQGSICDDFSDVMTGITDRIIEFTTRFELTRTPQVDTIKVYVDNVEIPQNNTNGWTYDSTANAIVFHGSAIPKQDSNVQVFFDPTGIK